jgi:hypothetical protein
MEEKIRKDGSKKTPPQAFAAAHCHCIKKVFRIS